MKKTRFSFNHDLYEKDISLGNGTLSNNYLTTDYIDGEYIWLNNLISPKSINDIIQSSFIVIDNGNIRFSECKGKDRLLWQACSKMTKNGLYVLINESPTPYKKIIRFMHEADVIEPLSFNAEVDYYIQEMLKVESTLISKLYLSALHFMKGDIQQSKIEIVECLRYIYSLKLKKYIKYFRAIYKLYSDPKKPTVPLNAGMIRPTELALGGIYNWTILYTNRIVNVINQIEINFIDAVKGNREKVISVLHEKKFKILLFWGHGDRNNGYAIHDGINDTTDYEFFTNEDLKNLLKQYDKASSVIVLDLVCTHDHFYKIGNYNVPVYLFSNRLSVSERFNVQSGYYFAIGFLYALAKGRSINASYKLGMISLSLFGEEHIDTYSYDYLKPSL